MLNFDFKRPSRKCAAEDRTLAPGEKFFSALVEGDDGQFERIDLGENAWDGPPENCIGWWSATVPQLTTGRVYWAPNDVLLAFFQHVYENQIDNDITYLTGLVLVQKKILRLIETRDDQTPHLMILRHAKSKTSYEVPVSEISPERTLELQNELAENLFTDRAPNQEDDPGADD